jgi:hypothetical protein
MKLPLTLAAKLLFVFAIIIFAICILVQSIVVVTIFSALHIFAAFSSPPPQCLLCLACS